MHQHRRYLKILVDTFHIFFILIWQFGYAKCDTNCAKVASTPRFCSKTPWLEEEFSTCSVDIKDFPESRKVPANMTRPFDPLPPWFNLNLAKLAQKVYLENKVQIATGTARGAVICATIPEVRDVLMYTGKSKTPKKPLATIAQTWMWFTDTLKDKNPSPYSNLIIGLQETNKRHELIQERIEKEGGIKDTEEWKNAKLDETLWAAFEGDLNASFGSVLKGKVPPTHLPNAGTPPPFNQMAMSLVLFHLLGFPVIDGNSMNIKACDEEIWGYNHMIAVIGYVLGIEDKYNIALQPSLAEVREIYMQIKFAYVVPALLRLDKKTKVYMEVILKSVQGMLKDIITTRLVMYQYLRYILQIEAPKMKAILSEGEVQMNSNLIEGAKPGEGTVDFFFVPTPFLENFSPWTSIKVAGDEYCPGSFDDFSKLAKQCFS